MAEWLPKSVALSDTQKTAAKNEVNSAKRINSILAAVIANVDKGFTDAGVSVDNKITEAIDNYNGVVDQKFADLKAGIGTNFSAPDIAGRDALTNLSIADICFVEDNGDGKWAKYEVTDISNGTTGDKVTWVKLLDQDMLVDVNINDAFAGIQNQISQLEAADTANLQEAKDYADQVAAAAGSAGTDAAAQALTDAKAYTDEREAVIRTDLDPSVATHLGSDADWGL